MDHYFYSGNIEKETVENENYRQVVYTIPKKFQLVLMSLLPGEEIGREVHPNTTQFFRIEEGFGVVEIDNKIDILKPGSVVIVPPGAQHNIVNLSTTSKLKLYTIYSPPEHPPNAVEKVRK